MAFKYGCFISYQHGDRLKDNISIFRLVIELAEDLLNELDFFVDDPAVRDLFVDMGSLRGEEFLNERIAEALCQSVCMLCLWTPTYFSKKHTYCAREYWAMETLEKKRWQLLNISEESHEGIIIPLTLRYSQGFPRQIVQRPWVDFEQFLLPQERGLHRNSGEYREKIKEIANYIAIRHQQLSQIPKRELESMNNIQLPRPYDQDFMIWLDSILSDRSNQSTSTSQPKEDKLRLIDSLEQLIPSQFNKLIIYLDIPAGIIPPPFADRASRVYALWSWAESPTGCGRKGLKEAFDTIVDIAVFTRLKYSFYKQVDKFN